MNRGNLFHAIKMNRQLSVELVELLSKGQNHGDTRIERIVSPPGYSSKLGFWYDQPETEFVLLLRGTAKLEFNTESNRFIELAPGDYLVIQPHQKHRIAETSHQTETIWLTVFF